MTATAESILSKIKRAGVVGAGGAGFPTYKKLESKVEYVIANGAECEPLLQKDRESMLQESDAFLRGLRIMGELTAARQVTIAVKEKNEDVAAGLQTQIEAAGFTTFVYEDVYPAGDEYILVYEITGRQIPPGGIPLAVGCVVANVETIINIAHAVEGRPVTNKYLTVAGAVAEPLTTVVPVGTSIADCIQLAGGALCQNPIAMTGGLMMGGVTSDFREPVTKTMGGIIVLPADHYLVGRKTASRATYTRIGHGQCDQCSLCTELCPRYILGYPIEPHKVMRTLLMTSEHEQRGSLWAEYCCECNVCSLIACPEQLDPKSICVDAKAILRENGKARDAAELKNLFRPPHPARKGREIPIRTLYTRLGLKPYDRPARFAKADWQPSSVTVPLDSHIGQPAKPIVRAGEQVRHGDLIGVVEDGQLGCPVHASIDGCVTGIFPSGITISQSTSRSASGVSPN